jgi:hypothetical protein
VAHFAVLKKPHGIGYAIDEEGRVKAVYPRGSRYATVVAAEQPEPEEAA